MDPASDLAILQLLKQRDTAGYKALFDKYYKSLCLQAFVLVKDGAAAEDLVQEVFVKCWREQKFDDIRQSLNAYLSTAVKNAALNVIKKQQREEARLNGRPDATTEARNWDLLELQETVRGLELAIQELPQGCRRIFELVCLDGKKYQEAADLAGVSLNTVKTQLQRAFTRLRQSLEQHYYFIGGLSPVLYFLLSYLTGSKPDTL